MVNSGQQNPCRVGAHFSIAGGLHQALVSARRYGCTVAQLFTKNASTWRERYLTGAEIEKFRRTRRCTGILRLAAHTSYLINMASPEDLKWEQSRAALEMEIERAAQLGIDYVVLHPGAHMKSGRRRGIQRIVEGLNRVLASCGNGPSRRPDPPMDLAGGAADGSPRLLLENTAGQGTILGRRYEELAEIIDGIEHKERIGICLDTCHLFAAGYDLRTPAGFADIMERFDAVIGLQRLECMHLNDARGALASRLDRHDHIGEGNIGLTAFHSIMNDRRLFDVPKIIETPKTDEDGRDLDAVNLDRLRRLCGSRRPPRAGQGYDNNE